MALHGRVPASDQPTSRNATEDSRIFSLTDERFCCLELLVYVVPSSLSVDLCAAPWDLESVYRCHSADVARWAARWAGPGIDVEDMVHEVFLVVQRRLSDFRGDAQMTTWLYRITANVVRHHRRRARIRTWFRLDDAPEPTDPSPGPLAHALAKQALTDVYAVMETLPERQRRVFLLHTLEGLTGPQIAELEDVPAKTVWVWIHRARKRFANELAKKEARS